MQLIFRLRPPFPGELEWFKSVPGIPGYAAEDDAIVLNPFTKLSEREKACIIRNEGIRLLLRKLNLKPSFRITSDQLRFFAGTAYESNESAICETLVARIASGDPSAGESTGEQIGYALAILDLFGSLVTLECDEKSDSNMLRLALSMRISPGAQSRS